MLTYPLLTPLEQVDLPSLTATPTALLSQFEDSTHQAFLCDTADGRMVLKVCDEVAVAQSGFWQGVNHLFGADFPKCLARIQLTHDLLTKQGLYAVPDFVASNCSAFEHGFVLTRFIDGIDMLASMRLCCNVPAQYAIQTALGGYQSINDLIVPGGRLWEQRELAWIKLNKIKGVSCVKPDGALYMFVKLDPEIYPVLNDEQLVLDLLKQQRILIVHGTGFNLKDQQHFRFVFLPRVDVLEDAINRFETFLKDYEQLPANESS